MQARVPGVPAAARVREATGRPLPPSSSTQAATQPGPAALEGQEGREEEEVDVEGLAAQWLDATVTAAAQEFAKAIAHVPLLTPKVVARPVPPIRAAATWCAPCAGSLHLLDGFWRLQGCACKGVLVLRSLRAARLCT